MFSSPRLADFRRGTDRFTKALLHCQGANGATTFLDETRHHTWAAVGDAQISTAQAKFGVSSAQFDGVGDWITAGNSPDWDFGTGAFTIDFWVRRSGAQINFTGLITDIGGTGWQVAINSAADNKVYFSRTGAVEDIIDTADLPDITWTHMAVVRAADTVALYRGGTSVGTVSVAGLTVNSSGLGIAIGTNIPGDGFDFAGNMSEIRISKGIARWTATFTPPAVPYGYGGLGLAR